MEKISVPERLSALWIVIMLNMVFADIFSITVALADKDTWQLPGDAKTIMAIAAIVTNIPILMIYLSRVLPYKANRMANIMAAVLTVIYVIGGGDTAPHYIVIATIESFFLLVIIVYAVRWKMR
jgi:hypothetical protein